MDTTVALFFSLGLVMSPSDESVTSVDDTIDSNQIIAQQTVKPSPKATKRHELVKKRIAVTNAWLENQRKERRDLAQKHQPLQISLKTDIQSCGADWQLT